MTTTDRNGPWDFRDPWTTTHPNGALIDEESRAVVAGAVEELKILRAPLAQDDALAILHALVSLRAQIEADIADVVTDALDQEHSIEEIAGQLALSPADVRRRYAAHAERRPPLVTD